MKYLKEIGMVAATAVTVVVATKIITKKVSKIEKESNSLKESLNELKEQLEKLERANKEMEEVIENSLDNDIDAIKDGVYNSLTTMIERKNEIINKKSLDEISACFGEINENINTWKQSLTESLTISLTETLTREISKNVLDELSEMVRTELLEVIKTDLIENKVSISEDIIKASITEASEKMVEDAKEGLEEHVEGLVKQYIDDGNKELDKLKAGIKQVLIIELIKNGLTREQASMVIDEGKVLDMINSMSEVS